MKREALMIGLNRVSPAAYSGWDGKLQAAVVDAVALNAVFAQGGFTARTLLDEQATLASVIGELELAADVCEAGDAFVWSYSGHGSTNDKEQTFCLFDGELGDRLLHNLRARFKPGVRVVSIWDSCFSGGVPNVRGRHPHPGRSRLKPFGFPALRRTRSVPTTPIQCAELILTACRTTEESAEDNFHGFFTGALLDTLKVGQSWQEWFFAAASKATSLNPAQHAVPYQLGPQTIFTAHFLTFDLSMSPPVSSTPEFPTDPGPSRK